MIYLRYDIISVSYIREAYLIFGEDIMLGEYIIRDRRETDIIAKISL